MRVGQWCCNLVLVVLTAQAGASIEARRVSATLRIPLADAPAEFVQGDYSMFIWYRPSGFGVEPRALFQIPGLVELAMVGRDRVVATVQGVRDSQRISLSATASVSFGAERWSLLVMSYSRSEGLLEVWAQQDGGAMGYGQAVSAGLLGGDLGPGLGDVAVGAHPDGHFGAVGLYGLIALRNHTIDSTDFEDVFESRRFFGPYDLNNAASGGHMTGRGDCLWMLNHSMTTRPYNGSAGGSLVQRAAIVNEPVGVHNIHVFDRARSIGSEMLNFWVVREAVVADRFVYRSHHDEPYGGFFVRDLPGSTLGERTVPGTMSPKSRQILGRPRESFRVMVSSNSRAVGINDGTSLWPGNYVHGFIDKHWPKTAGVFFRPAVFDYDGFRSYPWFGLDARTESPRAGARGSCIRIDTDAAPWDDFSRFWTGAFAAHLPGSGALMRLTPGATYCMRCAPEPGSLLVADAPLVVEAHVLKFPGSSDLRWVPDRGASQGADGLQLAARRMSLDSTLYTHVLTDGDAVISDDVLSLAGDLRGRFLVGDACFVAAGSGQGALSLIESVTFGQQMTRVDLTHPFGELPGIGSTLKFGPWAFETVQYLWAPIEPGDPQNWRGIELQADDDAGAGVLVMAYSAWRPDVAGFIWGSSGAGGRGYREQVEDSFEASNLAWMEQTQADVWLQVPAQQRSLPSSMSAFADLVRTALPDVELIWAGECDHPSEEESEWNRYILDHAADEDVIGLNLFEHPRFGSDEEQLADGLRSDVAHINHRGNRRLADLWTEQLLGTSNLICTADFNLDGSVNVADILAFLNAYNTADPRADLNNDGQINIQDFLAFLNAYSAGCD